MTYHHRYLADAFAYGWDAGFNYNFHEVVPNKVYRSAKMDWDELTETLKRKKVASVINLRLGGADADADGVTEEQVVTQMGIAYKHIPVNSRYLPDYRKLQELFEAFDTLPRPILIHCSSGTYRSGFASAIFLLDQEGESIDTALQQLSIRYGYFKPARDIRSYLKGREFMEKVLYDFNREGAAINISFREWIAQRLGNENKDNVTLQQSSLKLR